MKIDFGRGAYVGKFAKNQSVTCQFQELTRWDDRDGCIVVVVVVGDDIFPCSVIYFRTGLG